VQRARARAANQLSCRLDTFQIDTHT
jgi:hypothetical protein